VAERICAVKCPSDGRVNACLHNYAKAECAPTRRVPGHRPMISFAGASAQVSRPDNCPGGDFRSGREYKPPSVSKQLIAYQRTSIHYPPDTGGGACLVTDWVPRLIISNRISPQARQQLPGGRLPGRRPAAGPPGPLRCRLPPVGPERPGLF